MKRTSAAQRRNDALAAELQVTINATVAKMKVKNGKLAVALAERCADAYMVANYGTSWTACAKLLLDRGYTEREAEAILRSKHMRWADNSEGRGDGNKTNSAAFGRYLNKQEKRGDWRKEVAQIAVETFATA